MQYKLLKDIIEWDVLNWAHCLKVWQPVINTLPANSKILAIGERNGGLSLWLAMRGFEVLCTDRDGVTADAKLLHERHYVTDKIAYRQLDIVNDEIGPEQYDVIILKSVLGGLKTNYNNPASRTRDTREKAILNIYRLLRPGGYLLTADNMTGSIPLQWYRSMARKRNGWHYFNKQELQSLFHSFSPVQAHYIGVLPTSFSSIRLNILFSFLNKYILNILPSSAKYIAVTTARK